MRARRDDEDGWIDHKSIRWMTRERDARLTTTNARRSTTVLMKRDPPYDESTLKQATIVARSVEQQIFAKAKDKESYEAKLRNKVEALSAKIIKDRAQAAMAAQGLTMAQAPVKPVAPKAEERRDVGAGASGTEYEEGKQFFEAQDRAEQNKLRSQVLKKWLTDNSGKSQLAVDFVAASTAEKQQIYKEKLRDHLDVWLFKHLTKRLEDNRVKDAKDKAARAELQGFVTGLMAQDADGSNEDERAAKRRATGASAVEPSPEYWMKVHEMNEKYHAPVSRALKSVQDFQSGGNRLGAVSQKFVDVLSKEILPTLEQKTSYRNPNIPATMEYLIKVENAIQKTLAKYELTKQVKQEKKRLEAMTSTQRAVASLTERGETSFKIAAREGVKESCAKMKSEFDVNADFTAELFDSDEGEEMSETFASDLLKDFWSGGDSLAVLPAGAPETWTLEAGKDVVAVAFRGDAMPESERATALAEY